MVVGFDGLTLNIVQFTSKYPCRLIFRVGSLSTRRQRKVTYFNRVVSLDCLAGDQELSTKRQLQVDAADKYRRRVQDRKTAQVVRTLANQAFTLARRSVTDQGVSARALYKHTSDSVTNSTRLRQPWSRCEDFHAEIKHRPHRNHGQDFH